MAAPALKPVLKIVEPGDVQAACARCGAAEHSLLFREEEHDVVECDRCGFAYALGVNMRPAVQFPDS